MAYDLLHKTFFFVFLKTVAINYFMQSMVTISFLSRVCDNLFRGKNYI